MSQSFDADRGLLLNRAVICWAKLSKYLHEY